MNIFQKMFDSNNDYDFHYKQTYEGLLYFSYLMCFPKVNDNLNYYSFSYVYENRSLKYCFLK